MVIEAVVRPRTDDDAGGRSGLLTSARAAAYYSTRPIELWDRVRSEVERRSEPRQSHYEVAEHPGSAADAVHQLLNVVGPCDLCQGFDDVWSEILASFPGAHHHDAGLGTVQGVWTATRHLRPQVVIETGVARGFSSAAILAAMQANGEGHLWSVDLPQVDLIRSGQARAAVPPSLAARWTYLAGGSRRLLPRLVKNLAGCDLFVHDSLHTYANMRFEMELMWPHLNPGGLLFVDDADHNSSFADFAREVQGPRLLRRQVSREGAFGLIRKEG